MSVLKKKQWKIMTPVGHLFLTASPNGLTGAHWSKQGDIESLDSVSGTDAATVHLRRAEKQLQEYFAGERTQFDIVLDLAGTDFQRKVWQQLQKIPFGKTISYQELAKRVKNVNACRAVGSANGKNPVSIIVPCHRVITSQGTIGGYAGGLTAKIKLLAVEGRGEF